MSTAHNTTVVTDGEVMALGFSAEHRIPAYFFPIFWAWLVQMKWVQKLPHSKLITLLHKEVERIEKLILSRRAAYAHSGSQEHHAQRKAHMHTLDQLREIIASVEAMGDDRAATYITYDRTSGEEPAFVLHVIGKKTELTASHTYSFPRRVLRHVDLHRDPTTWSSSDCRVALTHARAKVMFHKMSDTELNIVINNAHTRRAVSDGHTVTVYTYM